MIITRNQYDANFLYSEKNSNHFPLSVSIATNRPKNYSEKHHLKFFPSANMSGMESLNKSSYASKQVPHRYHIAKVLMEKQYGILFMQIRIILK